MAGTPFFKQLYSISNLALKQTLPNDQYMGDNFTQLPLTSIVCFPSVNTNTMACKVELFIENYNKSAKNSTCAMAITSDDIKLHTKLLTNSRLTGNMILENAMMIVEVANADRGNTQ